jgi:molybdopterin-guanine dinucleotide biosynthesis protein A
MSASERVTALSSLTAFILAGGKSARMGSDKAFLEFDGETLLSRALKTAREVAQEVRIIGDAKKFGSFAPNIEDVYPNHGPLGGIHAALSASQTEWNLILAVDLPLIPGGFLQYLVRQATTTDAVVTVPRTSEGWQPLCGVYRRDFMAIAERQLRAGRNKIDPLFDEVKTRIIDQEELARMGFSEEIFWNLNTPQDLETAREHFQLRKLRS